MAVPARFFFHSHAGCSLRGFGRCVCYKGGMDDMELARQVRSLRARGHSPKAIARALRVRPARVAALVRDAARQEAAARPEPATVGCWVSPGWSIGLSVPADRGWPDRPAGHGDADGLAGVLVARERRGAPDKVVVCGYLVDTYCLGVKNALGPRTMRRGELRGFVARFFDGFDADPLEAPLDLARELVWGGAAYARTLGFNPHPDFRRAASHLRPLEGPAAIGFGREGRPCFTQGPFDNADRVLRTLREHVGEDFSFTVEVSLEELARVP